MSIIIKDHSNPAAMIFLVVSAHSQHCCLHLPLKRRLLEINTVRCDVQNKHLWSFGGVLSNLLAADLGWYACLQSILWNNG